MSKLGLLCLLVVAAAAQSSYDPRLSIHTIVREDVFAGFMANDNDRMARGEKTVDQLLLERPEAKAPLTAWKGSIAMKRAVDAYDAKRAAVFETEYRKAQAYYAEATKLDPNDGGVLAVVAASHSRGALVKVIFETALLNDEQKTAACDLSKDAGADFVKTSTGFSTHGATVADVELMRRAVGPAMGVKASGGVRSLDDLQAMVAAGANRIGTSAGVQIIMRRMETP